MPIENLWPSNDPLELSSDSHRIRYKVGLIRLIILNVNSCLSDVWLGVDLRTCTKRACVLKEDIGLVSALNIC